MREYNNNPDFKEYVDKYCAKHGIDVEEALEHKIVVEYLQFLLNRK